jgi:hypothetical protein
MATRRSVGEATCEDIPRVVHAAKRDQFKSLVNVTTWLRLGICSYATRSELVTSLVRPYMFSVTIVKWAIRPSFPFC